MGKHNPFTCNFCGGKLMFYSQLEFTPELRKVIAEQTATKGIETFKVQKCEKCQRTYIWLESHITVYTPEELMKAIEQGYTAITWVDKNIRGNYDKGLQNALASYDIKRRQFIAELIKKVGTQSDNTEQTRSEK